MIVVDIKLNAALLATYGITRIEDGPEPEKLNTYKVARYFPDTRGVATAPVTLQHKYDDPVEDLVLRAVTLAVDAFGPTAKNPRL